MSRFGINSIELINRKIDENVPKNTKKSKEYVWKQFTSFCDEREYVLEEEMPVERLALILKDWSFNMRKIDGSDYKECVVKTTWNTSAKLLQETYNEYSRNFDPFKDIFFNRQKIERYLSTLC
ncbi:unnamed protein product [Psylliodes chrysocephalus]|uniref:Uncharacterized protein n=1 Tax=Psylliodes chrysocephalus TaxID=3402493 RepID=A0A9P0G6X5_9CUCU|nr:unnamed protein product [Psylliodes chrysocephala]